MPDGNCCGWCGGEMPPATGGRQRLTCSQPCKQRLKDARKTERYRSDPEYRQKIRDRQIARARAAGARPRRPGTETNCEWCRTAFPTVGHGSKRKRFCGRTCQSAAWKAQDQQQPDAALTARCIQCGEAMAPRRGQGPPRLFCSDACSCTHRRNTEGIQARCAYCDGAFMANKHRLKYCSNECRGQGRRTPPSSTLQWSTCQICQGTWCHKGNRRATCADPACQQGVAQLRRAKARERRAGIPSQQRKKYWKPKPPRRFTCRACGNEVTTSTRRLYCSDQCEVSVNRLTAKARRKMREDSTRAEPVYRKKVYARDQWRCQLCHRKVSKARTYPDPLSPSLDHIVPLADGGEHSMANVQLAHLRCNVLKGARSHPAGEQLRLVG